MVFLVSDSQPSTYSSTLIASFANEGGRQRMRLCF
jgi:hypothetical protein